MRRSSVVLLVIAIGLAVAPTPAVLVERFYSSGLFPPLQSVMTDASNAAPFALIDPFALALLAWLIAATWRDWRRHRRLAAVLGRVATRLLTTGAAAYLAFMALWGFNYRRVPLEERVAFDRGALTVDAARSLAATSVARLNDGYDAAYAAGWPSPHEIEPSLAAAAAMAQREAGAARAATPGRPKPTLLDLYFRRAGVDGMTDPIFLETLVNSTLLPFERPFVVAHEWAHLAGFTDEGEANFVGWLTCVRGDAAGQYSGWLGLYGEVMQALPPEDRRSASRLLADGPRADLRAIAARVSRDVSPRVSVAGWRVYDRYLRANRVSAGAASYQGVVRLVLGTAIGSGVTGRTASSRGSPR